MTDLTRVGERGKLKPLPGKRPHFQRLRQGVFVGYRPPVTGEGPGTWVARARDEIAGNYRDKSLGDYGKLAGSEMFAAAKRDTEAFAIQVETGGMPDVTIVTVADACRAYDAKGNDKSTLNRLVFNDPIGMVRLDRLRRQHLREWRSRLTGKPSTINRAMVPLRAALGAVKEPGRPGTDAAWQEALKPAPRGAVKPEERKREYLPVEYRRALAKLTPLVKALTLLPVRPGALAALRVKDFDKRTGMLTIPKDKAGAGRTIPLSGVVMDFIAAQCQGKTPAAWIFSQPSGRQWKRHDWAKLLRDYGIEAYDIRHAVLTDLADAGVPPNALAKLAGTSVAMLETTYYKLTSQTAADALARLAGG